MVRRAGMGKSIEDMGKKVPMAQEVCQLNHALQNAGDDAARSV